MINFFFHVFVHLLIQIFFNVQQTALHWAAKHGKPEVIKLLASQRNVDINKRTVSLELDIYTLLEFEVVKLNTVDS